MRRVTIVDWLPLCKTTNHDEIGRYIKPRHFVNNLSNFLQVLLAVFIPWSAINLTDYFLVRRGKYDVTAFFIPNGVYGRVAWRGEATGLPGL